jgi:hypothetical protein
MTLVIDPEKFYSITPTGLYKFALKFNATGKGSFLIEVNQEIVSEIKTSF